MGLWEFYTTLNGRIGRGPYWLGVFILVGIGFAVNLVSVRTYAGLGSETFSTLQLI